jgi:Holliday junction resolvase RusA-like endonuclease
MRPKTPTTTATLAEAIAAAVAAKVHARPSPASVRFVVEGEPVPKGRARSAVQHASGGKVFVRHYTPAETEAYEERVRVVAQCAVAQAGWWTAKADRFSVLVRVFRRYEGKGGDLDNYVKSAIDAMIRGVVLPDDRYVRGIGASLFEDAARPRLEVEVRKIARPA